MSETTKRKGHCLCGAVTITANKSSNEVCACHCEMCRRWGGGPYMEIGCGSDVQFSGEEHISVFSSSKWAERGFCRDCGTHLFYRLKGTGEHMVAVGLFDTDAKLTFAKQVFTDERPAFYEFSNETTEMTGKQLFALYSPPE